MARITLIAGHVPSVVNSMGSAAERLLDAGHEVVFATAARDTSTLRATPHLDGVPEGVEHRTHVVKVPDLAPAGDHESLADDRTRRVDVLDDPDVVGMVDDTGADLTIVDCELASQLIALAGAGRPVAATSTLIGTMRDLRIPPLDTHILPGDGIAGSRPGIAVRWARRSVGSRLGLLRQRRSLRGDDIHRQYRRLAERHGLDAKRVDVGQWLRPLVIRGVPMLELTPAELDFGPVRHPDLVRVGPMLGRPSPLRDPEALTKLASVRSAAESGMTVVYASFGTFADSYGSARVEQLAEVVTSLPDHLLVLGTGGHELATDLGDRVVTFAWAPQRELLGLSDVCVGHAGIASVHEAIDAGTPMILRPMTFDQPGNAARVAAHGLGVRVDDATTSDEMRSHIRALTTDTRWAERVRTMRDHARRYRSDRVFEHTVDRIVTSTGRARRANGSTGR